MAHTPQPDAHIETTSLTAAIAGILEADGCGPEEALCVAEHLVDASCAGHDSHGVIRILRYHEWLTTGQLKPRQSLKLISDLGALRQFDGGSGMGQWLGRHAIEQAIEIAEGSGFGAVALRNAGHIGRVGTYAEQAAKAGLVSIMFVNVAGSRLVAPFGTARRAGSTAPVTIGVPNPAGDDFILDFATSLVAEGKALVAAQGGAALTQDALVDEDATPTRNPGVLYGETVHSTVPDPNLGPGALRAFGLHKGSGLMLACELLGGALTGNGTNGATTHRFGNGLLAILIDPARLDDLGMFQEEVAQYLRFVQEAPPANGIDEVMIPGDKERKLRVIRRRDGIPMPGKVYEGICALTEAIQVPPPKTVS